MNKETFAHGIYRLFAAKGRDATPAIVDTWYQLLKDFDEDEIMERFFKMCYEPEWPTVDAVLKPLHDNKKLIAENDYQKWCRDSGNKSAVMADMCKQNPGWFGMDDFDKKRFMAMWYDDHVIDDVDKIINAQMERAKLGNKQLQV